MTSDASAGAEGSEERVRPLVPTLPPVLMPEIEADEAFVKRLDAALASRDPEQAAALARIAIGERIDASFPQYEGRADGYDRYEWQRECLADTLLHLVRGFGLLRE